MHVMVFAAAQGTPGGRESVLSHIVDSSMEYSVRSDNNKLAILVNLSENLHDGVEHPWMGTPSKESLDLCSS